MDTSESDPYEQQLLAVFESCDGCCCGSLDRSELQRLCELLPLDTEQTAHLMDSLLLRPEARVTFFQFRDGLLSLLGSGVGSPVASGVGSPVAHSSPEKMKEEVKITLTREESPDREVSPKLVLGQKKYGRRSRPESSEHDIELEGHSDNLDDPFIPSDKTPMSQVLQRPQVPGILCFDDIDESDAHNAKKRRTIEESEKFPRDLLSTPPGLNHLGGGLGSLSQEEEFLRAAWQRFGKDGFVNQSELALVCECIGIEKLSHEVLQQLFDQLDIDRDGRISLEEFLLLFRSGGSWTSPTTSTPASQASSGVGRWTPTTPSGGVPLVSSIPDTHSGGPSLSLVECNGLGMASSESIIEMWESVGVSDPARLLRDLIVDDAQRSISITYLAGLLDEEIKQTRSETAPDAPAPSAAPNNLLQAALSLRQAELRWVRSSMEQMAGERDKLRSDLADANQRANLLAQEIDDHHSKLEKYSQNQVKLLEHRHAEAVRDLSTRLGQEREQLVQQNTRLERQVALLQQTEAKFSSEISSLRAENESLDQENRSLTEQVSEYEEARLKIEKELQEMANLQQRLNELEASRESSEVQELLKRLSELQAENSSLRDKNDELGVELEVLLTKLSHMNVRRHGSSNGTDAGLGGGTKRRGNSPLTVPPTDDSGDEESPRIGKVRRCSHRGEVSLDAVHIEGLQIHPLGNSESGVEADFDVDDSENLSAGSFERLGSGKLMMDQWMRFPSETSSVIGSQDDLINLSSLAHSGESEALTQKDVVRLRARIEELEQALQLCRNKSMGNHDTRQADLQGLKEVEEGAIYMSDEDTPTSSLEAINVPGTSDAQASPVAKNDEAQPDERLQADRTDLESQLKQQCDNVKIEIVKILSEKRACSEENCILKKRITDLRSHLPDGSLVDEVDFDEPRHSYGSTASQFSADASANMKEVSKEDKEVNTENTDVLSVDSECSTKWIEKFKELEESHASTVSALSDRCADLEKSLALMRDEYERCEDYWAGKLDEERQLAEQEQKITDEKFAELLSKIREYEELFADDHARRLCNGNERRLETIEERDGLEKQVTDLEEELEEFRRLAELQIAEKDAELKQLRGQLFSVHNGFSSLHGGGTDVAVQVSDLETGSWGSDRTFVVKPAKGFNQTESLQNGAVSDNVFSSTPSTSSASDSPAQRSDEDNRDKCTGAVRHHQQQNRQRRMRHHPHYVALNCLTPQDELQATGLRLREQEQACVRLQRALRIQQHQTQALLHHTWEKHKQEISDLQNVLQCTHEKLEQQSQACRDQMDRLTKSDVLVKELYVENAHLLATIQNLEQRCHILMQHHASISSSDNCSSV